MLYPVAMLQKDGRFHAHLPDLPDLKISGDSMANTISCARYEVIQYLQTLAETEQPLPSGSDISQYLSSGEYAGWTWAIVHIEASRIIGEDVAVTLNIPHRLVQKLSKNAEAEQMTLKTYIINTLIETANSNSV